MVVADVFGREGVMSCMRVTSRRSVWLIAAALALTASASEAAGTESRGAEKTGREVYESICITCHGPNGKGTINAALTQVIQLPDFSDCSFASRERDLDWLAVAHRGGPARGFSPLMAPWADQYTGQELQLAVNHIRTFCTDPRWPRGELNLPRPLVTGKAFPEDEAVVTASASTADAGAVVTRFTYERRIGPLNQIEASIPIASSERPAGGWATGLGDVALGYKRTLAHDLARGYIVSASAEVALPTGSSRRDLGSGTTVFEPFLAFGQILPGNMFLQAQAGFEVPWSRDRDDEAFWRVAFGRTFAQGRFGRNWSPMLEALAARPLTRGAVTQWDLVPQMQVTLSARQHIMANAGVRLPVNDRRQRSATIMVYLLWDWYDGGFFQGW
jgi:cytochrome c553